MPKKPTYAELEQKIKHLETKMRDHEDAELALQQSRAQLRLLSDQTLLSIVIIQDGKIVYANNAYAEMSQYPLSEIMTWRIEDTLKLVHPDFRQFVLEQAQKKMKAEKKGVIINYQYKGVKKSGEEGWVDQFSESIIYNGKPADMISMIEITDRKKAVKALKDSEERFRRIFEKLTDVYFETTLDGTIKDASPSAEKISGYALSEIIGNRVDMLYQNLEDREGLLKELARYGSVRGYEMAFRKKNGELYDISINADIYCDDNGKPAGMTGTIRDITIEKKLKERLQRSKKMESLGLMASGIAHDLNNILSGIVSYPDLLLLDIPLDSPLRAPVETIKDSGQRASDVVADLLSVAKGVTIGKEVANLNTLVTQYLGSGEYKRLERKNPGVVYQCDLDDDLLNINCSPSHMKKILMNLVSNASEAIEDEGKVIIMTTNKYLDKPLSGYEDVQAGEYVQLRVADTGAGISQKHINRIFEPFYTKKMLGRSGTGLGLAVVWNSVQDHEGYINVASSDKGTIFELYFPIDRNEVVLEDKIDLKDFLGNGERILVVDDEKSQREIACGLLKKLGYNAEAAASGEGGLEYLKNQPVDLLVLDMIMSPGINGRETYERALIINPKQKAIIASGLAETDQVIAAQKLGAGQFVKKPYTLEKIGLAVRDELLR